MTLVLFGATGDLSLHYLLPTLLQMEADGLLSAKFRVIAVGRRDLTASSFFKLFVDAQALLSAGNKDLARFRRRVKYFRGDMDNKQSFSGLKKIVAREKTKLYYFATTPDYFARLAKLLQFNRLLGRDTRVIIEKPFGADLKSARALNSLLRKFFSEQQIYRIDHYLGKETVQNLLVARFANDFLEPIWRADYIDHVEVSVLESAGAGHRARFYNQTGALRDLVQNHILQILALIAMERPASLQHDDVRNEKVKVLKALRPLTGKTLARAVVRGQYHGFALEAGEPTKTETFVALKTFVDLPRWQGVPFYLRTGKHLPRKVAEVTVHFKKNANQLFNDARRAANIMTFRIQPNERVKMQVNNKIPGPGLDLHTGDLKFSYRRNFSARIPAAYERLLLDFMQGDQRLFLRSDEIEAAWKFVDSITSQWNKLPLHKYAPGSTGPKAADQLMTSDKRQWTTK